MSIPSEKSGGYFYGVLSFFDKCLLRRYTPGRSVVAANEGNLASKEEDVGGAGNRRRGIKDDVDKRNVGR